MRVLVLIILAACAWFPTSSFAQKVLYNPVAWNRGEAALKSGDVEGALRNYCEMFEGRSEGTLWTLSAMLVCEASQVAPYVASIQRPLPVFVQMRIFQGKPCYRICAGLTKDRNEAVMWRTLLPQKLLAEGPFPVPVLLPCPSYPELQAQDLPTKAAVAAPAPLEQPRSALPAPLATAGKLPLTVPDSDHRAEGEAWFQKGLSAQSKGQRAQAAECYQKALGIDPDRPEVLNNLGILSLEASRYAEAKALFARAIAQSPSYARAHLNLAGALWGLDRHDEALAEARTSVAMDPTAVAAHLTLASFLLAMNMKVEASEEARKVLLLEPGNLQAKVFLSTGAQASTGKPGP
jgi:tetratricopeptide (TPR) repeat protein